MFIRISVFTLALLLLIACSNRSPMSSPQQTQTTDTNDIGYLRLIGPDLYGTVKESNDGFFKEATFLNVEAGAIWAIFKKNGSEWQRLPLTLDFGQPLDFVMFTDKYSDEDGLRHIAVYSSVRFATNNPVEGIRLAVVDAASENDFDQYFRVVQPTQFGEVVSSGAGEFIEARFEGLNAEDVWAILRTNANGVKGKINFARKMNKPIYYYLKNDSTGIRVGLPWDSEFPDKNIEVVIER